MRLSIIFLSCFKGQNEAATLAIPETHGTSSFETSQQCSAPAPSAAPMSGRLFCASRDEGASPITSRSLPYVPFDISTRPSFCVEQRKSCSQVLPEQRYNVEYTTADELVKGVQNLRWLGQGAQGVVYEGTWQGATVAVKFSIVENLDATVYELLFSRLLSHPNVVQTFVAKVAVLDEKTILRSECSGLVAAAAAGVSSADGGSQLHLHPSTRSARAAGGNVDGRAVGVGESGDARTTAAAAASASAPNRLALGSSVKPSRVASAAAAAAAAASCGGGRLLAETACCDADSDVLMAKVVPPTPQRPLPQLQLSTRSESFQSDDGFGHPFGRRSTLTDVREALAGLGARHGHFITQMVMEHCDHGSLHSAIQKGIFKPTSCWGPKLALRALIRTAREVAQGMFHLHSNNVMHGDLKPANVLLINSRNDRRGYVAKVSDFGLAQFCPRGHLSDAPCGTLVYMAPERLLQGQLFPTSDVFSFGVMLWEMYHGQRPYEGVHQAQIVMAAAQGCAHLEWAAGSPPDIVHLSRTCMLSSPHDRPTFEDVMHSLADLEMRVRQDGVVRVSKSLDITCRGSPGHPCLDVAPNGRLPRSNTIGNVRKRRESLDPAAPAAIDATLFPPRWPPAVAAAAPPPPRQQPKSGTELSSQGHNGNKDADAAATDGGGGTLSGSVDIYSRAGGAHSQRRPSLSPLCVDGGSGAAPLCGTPSQPRLLPVPVPVHTAATSSLRFLDGAVTTSTSNPTITPTWGDGAGRPRPASALPTEMKFTVMCGRGDDGSGGDALSATVVDTSSDLCCGGSEDCDRDIGVCAEAAAIAAALAKQPGFASAVVTELLALLQRQQQEEEVGDGPPKVQVAATTAVGVVPRSEHVSSSGNRDDGGAAVAEAAAEATVGVEPGASPMHPNRNSMAVTLAAVTGEAEVVAEVMVLLQSNLQQQQLLPASVPPGAQTSLQAGRLKDCSRSLSSSLQQQLQPWERISSCGGVEMMSTTATADIVRSNADIAMDAADDSDGTYGKGDGATTTTTTTVTRSVEIFGGGSRQSEGGGWQLRIALSSTGISTQEDLSEGQEDSQLRSPGDLIAYGDRYHHQQQLQPCPVAGAIGNMPLVRRRSSHLPTSRRSSNLNGWECTTITE